MTNRRQFLRAGATLVTGVAALEAYDRLTWTRRFWSGWRFPKTYRVGSTEELRRAYDESWRGDTILIREDVTIDLPFHFTREPRGSGLLVVTREGMETAARNYGALENRMRMSMGWSELDTVIYSCRFRDPPTNIFQWTDASPSVFQVFDTRRFG